MRTLWTLLAALSLGACTTLPTTASAPGMVSAADPRAAEAGASILRQGGSATETIAVDTEKKLRVKIEDYNFDGYKDFSIVHNQYRTCQARY